MLAGARVRIIEGNFAEIQGKSLLVRLNQRINSVRARVIESRRYFQASRLTFSVLSVVSMLCTLCKARNNKPIRVLGWLNKTQAVKNIEPSLKFTICNSLQTEIVRQLNLTLLPEVFQSLIRNLKVKCSVKSGQFEAHKKSEFFSQYNQ